MISGAHAILGAEMVHVPQRRGTGLMSALLTMCWGLSRCTNRPYDPVLTDDGNVYLGNPKGLREKK